MENERLHVQATLPQLVLELRDKKQPVPEEAPHGGGDSMEDQPAEGGRGVGEVWGRNRIKGKVRKIWEETAGGGPFTGVGQASDMHNPMIHPHI